MNNEVSRREGLRERDYMYTMRTARRRFALERNLPAASSGFKAWARKTYNPKACTGKLRALLLTALVPR